nr:MAG: hypothetical protein EDM05_22075 [Leptolyngbya sp. IPPAS B-1204]
MTSLQSCKKQTSGIGVYISGTGTVHSKAGRSSDRLASGLNVWVFSKNAARAESMQKSECFSHAFLSLSLLDLLDLDNQNKKIV